MAQYKHSPTKMEQYGNQKKWSNQSKNETHLENIKSKALNVILGLLVKSFTAFYHDLSEPPFWDIDPRTHCLKSVVF